jgi:magnesium transporter
MEVGTRAYRDGQLYADGFALEAVSDHLEQPGVFVWVDLLDPSKAQLDQLAGELGLHELAVEDALGPHQRPKVDHYDTHLFIATHAVRLNLDGDLEDTEVDAFVDERWLITVRKDARFSIDDAVRRWERSPGLGAKGVGFLLYCILDVIVDGYFGVMQQFDDYYDEVSDGIFADHPIEPAAQRRWFAMRRALVRFHRLVIPMRETVSTLIRREEAIVADDLSPYYQDVYDHVLRVSESSEALRDLVASIVEANLSLRDYGQNQIVKQVTSWAAIIAVPTLISGFYGMNVPYPGSGEAWGAWSAGILTVALSSALYVLFRRRDWL